MRRIRRLHVFDRFAQQRLADAYGVLVPEQSWSTRRNRSDGTNSDGDGVSAGDGGGVLAGVEPSAAPNARRSPVSVRRFWTMHAGAAG